MPPNDIDTDILALRIERARTEAICYRYLNLSLFLLTKFMVPILSSVVAANLSISIGGAPFLNAYTMIGMTIGITVLSGVDTFINPSEKKRLGFLTANRLGDLQQRFNLRITQPTSQKALVEAVEEASTELKEIQDEYAQKGW